MEITDTLYFEILSKKKPMLIIGARFLVYLTEVLRPFAENTNDESIIHPNLTTTKSLKKVQ